MANKSKNPWANAPANSGTACNPPHPGMPNTAPKPSSAMPKEPKIGSKSKPMGGKPKMGGKKGM